MLLCLEPNIFHILRMLLLNMLSPLSPVLCIACVCVCFSLYMPSSVPFTGIAPIFPGKSRCIGAIS